MNKKIKEEFEYKTEMAQLLHLLANSLYTNKEIFLRELISNASDALNKIHFMSLTDSKILGEDGDLKIKVVCDDNTKEFRIQDNGIGMNKEDLQNNLGTIAKSGTQGFMEEIQEKGNVDSDFIGRFGVGFYSVFMVAGEVTVETRKYDSDKGFRWISDGTGKYSIEEIDKPERGTTIFFQPREDSQELCSSFQVENTIKKYSDFVSFPIEVNGEKKNKSEALWKRPKSEITPEEYNDFFKYISYKQTEPLHIFHLNIEGSTNSFDSVLFVPQEEDKNFFHTQKDTKIHLYVKRVFIQDDCTELLPKWLRFIYGIVDSQDLPLNVSREVTQSSPIMKKINDQLVKKILDEFAKWAKSDKEKFATLWKNFGLFLKEGIHMEFTHRDKLINLFHCYSSNSPDQLISLQEYVDRMSEDQKEIYYAYAKNKEAIENSPNYEYFLNKNIEVLFIYDEVDDFIMPTIGTYQEKTIVSIDNAEVGDLENKKNDDPEHDASSSENKKIIQYFKDVLGDLVADVVASKRLVDSPCTLVAGKDGMNSHMEKMMKMMNQNFAAPKRTLEINLKNPLIQNLKKIREKFPQDKFVKDCITQLYENAALIDGILEDKSKLPPRVNQIMQMASEYHLNQS